MNLFIDTNIFLSFYHLTSDDLEELKKLSVLLRGEKVRLLLPEQVRTEFQRNRDSKIADALKGLRSQKLNLQFPQLCKDYDEYSKLRLHQKQYEENHAKLLEKIGNDVTLKTLKADLIIKELFEGASTIPSSAQIVASARLRCDIGNPPGKRGSLGDAINWESLLAAAPMTESLYFITDDADYCSAMDDAAFDSFLLDEWSHTKVSQLIFYKRLSQFFKDHFPEIKLAGEYEKDLLINELRTSASFTQTHSIIARLAQFESFTVDQAVDIMFAAGTNNQVLWIINDEDVKDFLTSLLDRYKHQIEAKVLNTFQRLFKSSAAS